MAIRGDVHERAIDLGARGRYAAAWYVLAESGADQSHARDSRGLSIRASHLRQIGLADIALSLDARAIETARTPEASADAWLGWTADALAQGHVDAARSRFTRCMPQAGIGSRISARIDVRTNWVGAEIALASGDPDLAAARLVRAVASSPRVSARHLAKSLMFQAAVYTLQGDFDSAWKTLTQADAIIDHERWISLWWPWTLIADGLDHHMWGDDVPQIRQGLRIDRARRAVAIIGAHLSEDLAGRWAAGHDVQRLDNLAGRYPWQT